LALYWNPDTFFLKYSSLEEMNDLMNALVWTLSFHFIWVLSFLFICLFVLFCFLSFFIYSYIYFYIYIYIYLFNLFIYWLIDLLIYVCLFMYSFTCSFELTFIFQRFGLITMKQRMCMYWNRSVVNSNSCYIKVMSPTWVHHLHVQNQCLKKFRLLSKKINTSISFHSFDGLLTTKRVQRFVWNFDSLDCYKDQENPLKQKSNAEFFSFCFFGLLQYRKWRPKVSVKENPRAWWAFVGTWQGLDIQSHTHQSSVTTQS
jgi:hypothetical protein